MTIGERIKQRRLELGLSQEELAKRLGNKSRASVCTVEKDREDLTTDRIRKYAEALETTPSFLMGWEDEPDDSELKNIYEMYQKASPEVRSAVETLLRSATKQS